MSYSTSEVFYVFTNNNTLLPSLPNTTTAGLLLLPLSRRGGGCRRSCCPRHHCLIAVDEGRAAPLIYFLLLTLDGEGKTRERITLLQLFVKGNQRCCLPLVAQLLLLFHTNSPSISFEAAGEREERSRICHPSQLQLLCSLGEQGTLAAASAVDEGFRQPYVATASSLEEDEGRRRERWRRCCCASHFLREISPKFRWQVTRTLITCNSNELLISFSLI
nr:hypothetical protein Iba_chr15aCG11420 [Ipomoea batatas]